MTRKTLTRTASGYKSIKQDAQHVVVVPPDDTPTTRLSPKVTFYLVYLVFIATLGPLQFGYHLGELNAPQRVITCQIKRLPTAQSVSLTLPQCIPMNASQWGLVQSIFTIGGLLGALISGPISTRYGRLIAMRIISLTLFLGPLAESLAPTILVMTSGRLLSGMGAGAATVVCPIYIAEISPFDKRGLFGAFTQVMINLGILIAQVLGYFLSRDNLWRVILAVAGLIALSTFAALLFAPESPTWLAENNQPRLARTTLQRIRGHDADLQDEMRDWNMSGAAEEETLLGQTAVSKPITITRISFFDVVRIPKYRKALIAVTSVMMAQQLCGINSVVMYSVSILGTILPSAAALITVFVSCMNVVMTLACSPLADKIGRKPCLLLSIGGMGTSSMLLAIGLSKDIPNLTVVALFTFVCSFAVGLGPVPFILASELVGPEAVGAISSWALAGNWFSTFCVAQFFPIINAALSRGQVYWVFMALAIVLGSFIAWWLPETNGKVTVEEVWEG